MPQDRTVNVRIASKVDFKDNLTEFNPKLLDKEVVYERETGKYKIGNGIDHWNELPYCDYLTANTADELYQRKDYVIEETSITVEQLEELKVQGYNHFVFNNNLNIIVANVETQDFSNFNLNGNNNSLTFMAEGSD